MQTTSRPSEEDEPAKIPLENLPRRSADASLHTALDHHHAGPSNNTRLYRVFTACLLLFSAAFGWSVYTAFTHNDPWEASKCRMAYMSPGYLRQDGLNASHSRLAGKYSLWLYREQGWDLSTKPHGVPVLFAPGNAGSYRQIRSLAAAAARQYYSSPGKPDERLLSAGHQELDFFAADFNEDFSAFHAGTLKEQAEYLSDCIRYIRGLYKDQGATAPSAVIVIAHSMGGIAARYMFLQDGFDYGSVKILVTLSTPHTIPPATFDKGVERIYNDINSFWRKEHHSEQGLLNDTLSISIAGGIADTMISSDYADMSSLVPSSHGFSVITTSVPTLFSPVDHQAMMWCDQLRQQIVSALLRSTDVRRADRTRKLDERLTTFHHHLLTGIELLPSKSEPVAAAPFKRRDYEHVNRSLVLSTAERIEDRLYRLDFAEGQGGRVKVAFFGSDVAINYYTCEDVDDQSVCHPVKPRQRVNIPSDNVDPQSPASGSRLSFSVSDVEMPKSAVFCLLQISKGYGSSVQAHVQPPAFRVDTSLLGMYVFGWRHSTKNMPDSSSGMSWSFGRLDTPLIVYSLSVTANNECSKALPVVRVSSGTTFESHFFAGNVKRAGIHLHSGAPYLPATLDSSKGMMLQYWHDPACPLEITLSVNRIASLGTIVTRYRSIIASWPILVLLGAIRHLLVRSTSTVHTVTTQLKTFDGSLKSFLMCESCWWLSAAVTFGAVQASMLHIGVLPAALVNLLLGTRHLLLLLLIPAFLAFATCAVVISNVVLRTMVSLSSKAVSVAFSRSTSEVNHNPERSRSRLLVFAILSLFVLFFAPHQFAILSLFLMQFLTTIGALQRPSPAEKATSEHNYAVLAILLWLLPQNAPVLIVWLRNLQAGWWRPFPSDHNVFAILGPIMLVEHLSSGRHLQLPTNKWVICAADHALTLAMFVILLWGGRYVFVGGEIVNLLFIGFAVLQYVAVRKVL